MAEPYLWARLVGNRGAGGRGAGQGGRGCCEGARLILPRSSPPWPRPGRHGALARQRRPLPPTPIPAPARRAGRCAVPVQPRRAHSPMAAAPRPRLRRTLCSWGVWHCASVAWGVGDGRCCRASPVAARRCRRRRPAVSTAPRRPPPSSPRVGLSIRPATAWGRSPCSRRPWARCGRGRGRERGRRSMARGAPGAGSRQAAGAPGRPHPTPSHPTPSPGPHSRRSGGGRVQRRCRARVIR